MNALFAIIGVALIIGVIALKVWSVTRSMMKIKLMIGLIATGIVLIAMTGAFFYAEAGYQYMVQYPTGAQVHITKPGWNVKMWGDVLPFKKIITVRLTEEIDKESETASVEDNSVKVLFNDGVRAKISHSTRFRLPTDRNSFLKMVRDYRTEENLVTSSLVPVAREVIRNSARELGAQKYISGGGGVLENNIYDQMQNGIVLLSVKEETVTPTEESINPETGKKRIINLKPVIVTSVNRRTKKDGTLLRKQHPIKQYNIKVTQSTVEDVNFEPKFKEMIEQQRDAAAKANVEKQLAKQAEYAQKRIVAEGEKEKAAQRAKMEQEQVSKLIAAETAKKEEEFRREQAENRSSESRTGSQERKSSCRS